MPKKGFLIGHLTRMFNRKKYNCVGYTESKRKAVVARKRMTPFFHVRITKESDGIYKIWSRSK